MNLYALYARGHPKMPQIPIDELDPPLDDAVATQGHGASVAALQGALVQVDVRLSTSSSRAHETACIRHPVHCATRCMCNNSTREAHHAHATTAT